MGDRERRNIPAQSTDAPASTSAVVDGVARGVLEVDYNINRSRAVNIASIAYSPEDMESQRASPIEVDKYLSQEENWGAVKRETGLEERTANLSLHDLNMNTNFQQQQQQPLPSMSQVFVPSHYAPQEGEASGGASYTDMSSTLRVTREATNTLYCDPLQPATSQAPSELTQHLSRSALDPREACIEHQQQQQQQQQRQRQQQQQHPGIQQAQNISPQYNTFPFMNTPSPSDGSEASQGSIASPHISPQPRVQTGYQGMSAQGRVSHQQGPNPSPTFSSLMDDSPPAHVPVAQAPTYNRHAIKTSPTYNLVPDNDPAALQGRPNQRASSYSGHLYRDQQTPPSFINVSSRPPPPVSRSTRGSPDTTPVPSPDEPQLHQEEPKIRNGKMYTSYHNHNANSEYMQSLERQNRHPSGSAPPQGGNARVYSTGQYSEPSNVLPLPEVSLSQFLPGYGSVAPHRSQPPPHRSQPPPHRSQPPQDAQSLHFLGSQTFINYGNQSSATSHQAASQYRAPGTIFSFYTPKVPATAPAAGAQGGARRKTTSGTNRGGWTPPARNESPIVRGNLVERERLARRVARRHNRIVGGRRKRGCTCYRCQIVFASSGHLKRHMEAHGSNRRFRCDHPYCDVAYSRQDNLKTHAEKAIHRQEGDPYDIPVSDVEDECETDCGYYSSASNIGLYEPDDDMGGTPPSGGPGSNGGGGGGGGGGIVVC